METVFKFGLFPAALACALRYYLTERVGIPIFDLQHLAKWELWVYGPSLLAGLLSVWHYLARVRCPECGEGNARYLGTRDGKSWVGHDDKGRTVTRVEVHSHYECAYCAPRKVTWHKTRTVTRS